MYGFDACTKGSYLRWGRAGNRQEIIGIFEIRQGACTKRYVFADSLQDEMYPHYSH